MDLVQMLENYATDVTNGGTAIEYRHVGNIKNNKYNIGVYDKIGSSKGVSFD